MARQSLQPFFCPPQCLRLVEGMATWQDSACEEVDRSGAIVVRSRRRCGCGCGGGDDEVGGDEISMAMVRVDGWACATWATLGVGEIGDVRFGQRLRALGGLASAQSRRQLQYRGVKCGNGNVVGCGHDCDGDNGDVEPEKEKGVGGAKGCVECLRSALARQGPQGRQQRLLLHVPPNNRTRTIDSLDLDRALYLYPASGYQSVQNDCSLLQRCSSVEVYPLMTRRPCRRYRVSKLSIHAGPGRPTLQQRAEMAGNGCSEKY